MIKKAGKTLHKAVRHVARPLVLEMIFAVAYDTVKMSVLGGTGLFAAYSLMVYFFGDGDFEKDTGAEG